MKPTLTLVVSAYNEEKRIQRCLQSVPFAREIIVVDNSSTDGTAKLAQRCGAKVYGRPNQLMLNINKNYGFSKATSDWILNLDADEEIPLSLGSEIQKVLSTSAKERKQGYWISRKNMIFGTWIQHGLWWPDKQLRLFRRGSGKFPCKHIHEYIEIEGETGELQEPYIHHNYDSISQYLTKLERCTTSEAIALRETNYHPSWYDALRFPTSDFLKLYFAQSGYKDGLHGLVLSIFQAFYSFVVFCKLWEMEGFWKSSVPWKHIEGEMRGRGKDFTWWMRETEAKEAKNPLQRLFWKGVHKLL